MCVIIVARAHVCVCVCIYCKSMRDRTNQPLTILSKGSVRQLRGASRENDGWKFRAHHRRGGRSPYAQKFLTGIVVMCHRPSKDVSLC